MRSNKAQILQKAQSFTAKGQVDKAIAEWQKLLSESPNDGNIYNTIGDLSLKKGDRDTGIENYLKASEVFNDAGFSLKTIAVYKKILKLNPKRYDVYVKLGDLNASRGLTGNAIEDYAKIAKIYTQDGHIKEALEVYRKIADLDPKNTEIRLKLAELCLKEGFETDAAAEYLVVARAYSESGKTKEAEEIFEKVVKLHPSNEEARIALNLVQATAESSEEVVSEKEDIFTKAIKAMDRGVYDEAEQILRQITASQPNNPAYQEALGSLFIKKEQQFMAFAPLKIAARIYIEKGEEARAIDLMESYLSLVPNQVEARELVGQAFEHQGDQSQALNNYVQVIDSYRSVGSLEQAKALFDRIQSWDPDHAEVKRLLIEFPDAVSDPSISVEPVQAGGTSEQVIEVSHGSNGAEKKAPPESIPMNAEVSQGSIAMEIEAPQPETIEVDLEASKEPVDPVDVKDLFVEAEVYVKYGLIDKAIDQYQKALSAAPEHLKGHEQLKDLFQLQGKLSEAANVCLSMASIYKRREDIESYKLLIEEARTFDPDNSRIKENVDLANLLESGGIKEIISEDKVVPRMEVSQGGLEELPVETSLEQSNSLTHQQVAPDLSPSKHEFPVEISKDLQVKPEMNESEAIEAEIESRLFGDSLQPIPDSLSDGSPNLSEREEELTLERALDQSIPSIPDAETVEPTDSEEGVGPGVSQASGSNFVDLSEVLGSELEEIAVFEDPEASRDKALHSAISDFREKESAKPVGDVDCETRYNLGIAYSEMGLLSEAIEEFKKSLSSDNRYIDSCSMLATCYSKKGMTFESIQVLEEALADPRCEDNQQVWLWYDLAQLYEQSNRRDESLALFVKIYEKDTTFKDVVDRIQNLCAQLGKSVKEYISEKKAQELEEDADSMIDRIFDETSPGPVNPPKKQPGKKKTRISYI